jgi:precorrin-6A/cobalt-precorrin-6A reductase
MILVMGGTSEAREIVDSLDASQIVYTTVTKNSAHLAHFKRLPKIHLTGPLDRTQLVKAIKNNNIKKVIDATHPFAATASLNAIAACRECEIGYLRLERARVEIPMSDLIRTVSDFGEAVRVMRDTTGAKRIFLSIGVNNLGYFPEFIEDESREVYCQVLDIPESLETAKGYGVPLDRILASRGVPTMESIHRILAEFRPDLMVFKESGYQGGTDAKIEAGLITETPMIIIDRPQINYPALFEPE